MSAYKDADPEMYRKMSETEWSAERRLELIGIIAINQRSREIISRDALTAVWMLATLNDGTCELNRALILHYTKEEPAK